ncbi:polysaccharide deacetylase family protein [Phytomonospora sp. NPDC050363]|uniref:polysaccharide deacetylase family protein n=1 Tax=Phytomonospora sp. NPDC050363 TaxID=3155642 RepID=UPI0033F2712F
MGATAVAVLFGVGVKFALDDPALQAGNPAIAGPQNDESANPNSGQPSETPPPPPTTPPSPSPSKSKDKDKKPPKKSDNPYDRVMYTTGGKSVALTFDDGPDPTWTPKVLGKLREYGIKATFCLIGKNADAYPDLVADIVRDGHTLCNHSWGHDLKLGKKEPADIRADMQRTNDAIHRGAPGADIAYFRHPGGAWTNKAIDVAEELGMKSLNWTVDPADWEKPPAKTIAARVIDDTQKGSVVLMHDGGGDRSRTLEALDKILPNLQDRFKLVALRH